MCRTSNDFNTNRIFWNISYISGGAGFLPSTVFHTSHYNVRPFFPPDGAILRALTLAASRSFFGGHAAISRHGFSSPPTNWRTDNMTKQQKHPLKSLAKYKLNSLFTQDSPHHQDDMIFLAGNPYNYIYIYLPLLLAGEIQYINMTSENISSQILISKKLFTSIVGEPFSTTQHLKRLPCMANLLDAEDFI